MNRKELAQRIGELTPEGEAASLAWGMTSLSKFKALCEALQGHFSTDEPEGTEEEKVPHRSAERRCAHSVDKLLSIMGGPQWCVTCGAFRIVQDTDWRLPSHPRLRSEEEIRDRLGNVEIERHPINAEKLSEESRVHLEAVHHALRWVLGEE